MEDATIVPVFLARVSLDLPLDTPIPRQSATALFLQEAIEARAARSGIPVDARIERGRSYRHALRQAISHERYDQIVIGAASQQHHGFNAADIAWLLDYAPGEIVVLRPTDDERQQHTPTAREQPRSPSPDSAGSHVTHKPRNIKKNLKRLPRPPSNFHAGRSTEAERNAGQLTPRHLGRLGQPSVSQAHPRFPFFARRIWRLLYTAATPGAPPI